MNQVIFYGASWCPDCQRAKRFLNEKQISYTYIDIELDKEATARVESINNGKRIIPTIIINGTSYTNPQNDKLASVLGINDQGIIQLYGADWCPDCKRAKQFLCNNHLNYHYINIDKYDWAVETVETINNGKRIIPTILINGKSYTNPDNNVLSEVLDIKTVKEEKVYDVIIIGGGAAGLTTSIYAQRDRFDTLILEKSTIGGNAFLTEKIENYPGFQTISGPALMQKMEEQALVYGATIKTGEKVEKIQSERGLFTIKTQGNTYQGRSVVISTGSTYRKLEIPNETELIGAGIHFCATCDGAFYKDRDIIVIGGGNSALEESIFLAGFCKSVKIIHHRPAFSASETYIEKLSTIKNITTFMNKRSIEFETDGNNKFKGVLVEDNETKNRELLEADGTFIFIGLEPNTEMFKKIIDVTEKGFIKTEGLAQTSHPGIFAAGDCREGAIAQVAAATGEGVLASYGIKTYLKS